MGQFGDIFAAMGAPVLGEYLGAPIVYTSAAGGVPTAVSAALCGDELVTENAVEEGREIRRERLVSIPTAAVPSPKINATLSIDGMSYAIEAIESIGGGFAVVRAARYTRAELSREGYRAK